MPQSLSAVYVHAVFSTLGRRPFLADPDFRGRMHGYLVGTSKGLKCPTIQVGGVVDHVHILAILGRETCQAEWVREVKRASSKWAKGAVSDFAWQAGYGMFSVGGREVESVKAYIQNQEEHHRRVSFQEEFRAILAEHGMEWDERYVWD
jgi:putative transposase